MNGPADITLFFGRLHPLLVHLPIGLIVLLAWLELLAFSRRFSQANANAGLILAFAAPAALATALCGWLLSRAGGYDYRLLQWHKWTGIGTAAVCLLAASLYALNQKKLYRWCLFASAGVLTVASHLGGSLTHGSDYLVRYAPKPLRPWIAWLGGGRPAGAASTQALDPAKASAFSAVIQPIFDDKCLTCHGPEKSKAGLRLDSYAAMIKGGESGAAFVPGNAAGSLCLKRLLLPAEDENHMPPEGKPQPSADDITLLRWWIDAGTSADAKAADLKPPPAVARILGARFGAPQSEANRAALPSAGSPPPAPDLTLAEKLAGELGIAISLLAPNQPWLQCNAGIAATNFGDAQLARLTKLGPNLRWLDLAGTRVTDAGMASLAVMPNLTRLHLERSGITDAALAQVALLPNLEYLNLYGTAVTDAGLEPLRKMAHLNQLYLWQTKVTASGSQALVDARTDRAQIQQWEEEIQLLKARIRGSRLFVDLGVPQP